jgi:hypothetical protein
VRAKLTPPVSEYSLGLCRNERSSIELDFERPFRREQMTAIPTPTPPTKPKPTPEMIRQAVIADQAAARADVAAARAKATVTTLTAKAAKKAVLAKASPAKATDTRKITVLAKTNPHAEGSRRAGWFKQLKTGISVDDAVKVGVRLIYLQRMAIRKIIKIG